MFYHSHCIVTCTGPKDQIGSLRGDMNSTITLRRASEATKLFWPDPDDINHELTIPNHNKQAEPYDRTDERARHAQTKLRTNICTP
jgi:hypothetical protein